MAGKVIEGLVESNGSLLPRLSVIDSCSPSDSSKCETVFSCVREWLWLKVSHMRLIRLVLRVISVSQTSTVQWCPPLLCWTSFKKDFSTPRQRSALPRSAHLHTSSSSSSSSSSRMNQFCSKLVLRAALTLSMFKCKLKVVVCVAFNCWLLTVYWTTVLTLLWMVNCKCWCWWWWWQYLVYDTGRHGAEHRKHLVDWCRFTGGDWAA